ncbi:hypothetical protein K8R14_02140 [bacterium]|nr:hypothetical protein [bacterium]
MTDFLSSFSFSKMMSHVFPGFLFEFMLLVLIWFFYYEKGNLIDEFCSTIPEPQTNYIALIIIIIATIIIGTIFGIIIDGIQHLTITKCFELIYSRKKEFKDINEIYGIVNKHIIENFFTHNPNIKQKEQEKIKSFFKENGKDKPQKFNWYFYFPIIDNEKFILYNNELYYYYEFFSNISIVFFVMLLLVGFSLINYVIILFLLMLVCIYIAWRIFEKNYMIRISIVLGTLFNKIP